MSDWNDGYVTDIGYTFGYYAELNPLRALGAAQRQVGRARPVDAGASLRTGHGPGLERQHACGGIKRFVVRDRL